MLKYIDIRRMLGVQCVLILAIANANSQSIKGDVTVTSSIDINGGTGILTCKCLPEVKKWLKSLSIGGTVSVDIANSGSAGSSGYGGNAGGSIGGSVGGDTSIISSLLQNLEGLDCVDDNVSSGPVDSDGVGSDGNDDDDDKNQETDGGPSDNSTVGDPIVLDGTGGDNDVDKNNTNDQGTDDGRNDNTTCGNTVDLGGTDGDVDDSINSQVGVQYIVDIMRDLTFCPDNNFVKIPTVTNSDTTVDYYKGMSIEAALMMYQAEITINVTSGGQSEKVQFYDSKPTKLMGSVCESYPPRSIEANIITILDRAIMNGEGCPIAEGTRYPVPFWLRGVILVFDEPLPCGDYVLSANMDDPDGNWALWLFYHWTLSKDIHNCT